MAKFSRHRGLSEKIKQKALLELCGALVLVKNLNEAAKVLTDLLSEQEVEMISKRLQIAKGLLRGMKYEEIRKQLHVSDGTIARVQFWLMEGGSGYRMLIERGKEIIIPDYLSHNQRGDMSYTSSWIKRHYSAYYWPQLFLEEIICGASNRQRRKLLQTVELLKKSGKIKKKIFWSVEKILSEKFSYRQKKTSH